MFFLLLYDTIWKVLKNKWNQLKLPVKQTSSYGNAFHAKC